MNFNFVVATYFGISKPRSILLFTVVRGIFFFQYEKKRKDICCLVPDSMQDLSTCTS